MLLNDASNKAFDLEDNRMIQSGKGKFSLTSKTAKLMCFIWNTIAIAMREGGLDDLAYVDEKNNIISVPFTKEPKKETKTENKAKKSTKKTAKKGGVDEGQSS